MQIQEMYWKQKYESLEENYNTLKNEYEKSLSSTKSKTSNYTIFLKFTNSGEICFIIKVLLFSI